MTKSFKRKAFIFLILTVIFVIALLLSLFCNLASEHRGLILTYIRLPRVIKAIVAGSSLSLAGMFLQTISKNPLADPYLTGLSSGAAIGIVISILCFNSVNYSVFGFAGALLSAVLVISLSGFSKFSVTKLILIGLSLNLFSGSIISFLILTNPEKAYQMTLLLTGGFSAADVSNKLLVVLFLTVLMISAFFIPKLNTLCLDSRLVFKNQKTANKYSMIFIILAALLTSLSVYCAGILGFVGIICPLFVRLLLGQDMRILFFGNILAGATLLLVSNFLANNLVYPLIIPLGAVVAVVGTPFFICFLLRKGGVFDN